MSRAPGSSSFRPRRLRFLSASLALLIAGAAVIVDGHRADALSPKSRSRRHLSMRYVRSPYPGLGTSPSMEAAILATFPISLHREALNVAWCESRGLASARNGQYRGHFQIGRDEWQRFGSGDPFDAYANSLAAYRYYVAAGSWRPWQCQP